jgi:hypothetical protein
MVGPRGRFIHESSLVEEEEAFVQSGSGAISYIFIRESDFPHLFFGSDLSSRFYVQIYADTYIIRSRLRTILEASILKASECE